MAEEGKYIYGIIGSDEARTFGPIGVGGRGDIVSTISYRDVSAVISNYPLGKYELSSQNLIAHQRVIERIVTSDTILPTRAFTVATNAEEVRQFLRRRYHELARLLRDMDNKVELGLVVHWKDMAAVFQEIVIENESIAQMKERMARTAASPNLRDKMTMGEMVANALEAKKKREAEEVTRPLKKIALDFRQNDTRGDDMILNFAFLTDRRREKDFDNQVQKIGEDNARRMRCKYLGPMPPYNFVSLRL